MSNRAVRRWSSGRWSVAYLPDPPGEAQKYAYLTPQRRWILVTGFLFTLTALFSQARFSLMGESTIMYLPVVVFVAAVAVVSLYTSTRRRRIDLVGHRATVAGWAQGRPAEQFPSVDVFLPSCGEPLDVLANTYWHVARLQWPGRRSVLVLDDSARPAVAALAAQFGFRYETRPNRGEMKKAGNLKYGYEHSDGDVIAVFDADFVPRPDYLLELVPYLDDASVGIVQSPQFFESTGEMNWLQRGAGITQEFFYRWVQPSRDAAGSPICVGTCALYRRAALHAAGGFAQIGHSEDVHTGVKLQRAGFCTRYVPVNVSKGICPDSLDAFITQQYRWCTGSMSLLIDPAFRRMPLSWRQRLCFFSGFGYYIGTALLVFALPIPSLAMMWVFPEHFHTRNYLLVMPILLWTWVVIPLLLSSRWGPEMLRVQVIYAYAHAVAIWDTLRGRTAAWVPTGSVSRNTPLPARVRRLMRAWITATQVLLWSGLVHASVHNHAILSALPVVMILGLTTLVQVPILMRIPEPREATVAPRRTTRAAATMMAVTAAVGVTTMAAASAESFLPATVLLAARAVTPSTVHTVVQPTPVADQDAGQHQAAAQRPAGDDAREKEHGRTRDRKPPAASCNLVEAHSSRTFVDTTYEQSHYRIGYDEVIRYCVQGHRVKVVSTRTTPDLLGSDHVALVITSVSRTVISCGDKCAVHTTVVRGQARNLDRGSRIMAQATATIRTTLVDGRAVVESSIRYRRGDR